DDQSIGHVSETVVIALTGRANTNLARLEVYIPPLDVERLRDAGARQVHEARERGEAGRAGVCHECLNPFPRCRGLRLLGEGKAINVDALAVSQRRCVIDDGLRWDNDLAVACGGSGSRTEREGTLPYGGGR